MKVVVHVLIFDIKCKADCYTFPVCALSHLGIYTLKWTLRFVETCFQENDDNQCTDKKYTIKDFMPID